jgi:hypothetical protein
MLNLQQVCEQLPLTGHILVWVGYLFWEYVIGKTKFGSTLGVLIEAPIKKALNFLKLG